MAHESDSRWVRQLPVDRMVAASYAERGCRNKVRFRSRGAAEAAIRSFERRGWRTVGLEPYVCAICHAYHFGHGRRREAASIGRLLLEAAGQGRLL